jgi:hypothetical protein
VLGLRGLRLLPSGCDETLEQLVMAHPYATDSDERKMIPLFIAALAIISAMALSRLLESIHWPGWIDAPATAGFYGLYYEAFRRWIWRMPILQRLGIVKVPVLNGSWQGHVVTSFDELEGRHPVTVHIVQDWTHLLVRLQTEYSRSQSLVGSILVDDEVTLSYDYRNEPLPGAAGSMHAHRGSAVLRYDANAALLEGEYFSGRDRSNYGALHLQRQTSDGWSGSAS